jgi:hypothetical protein
MQRDLVLRWIEQLAQLIARLLRARSQPELLAARDQVAEATAGLLGPLSGLVPRLELESAAELLVDPDRIFGYARLLDLEGAITEALGDGAAAADARARALGFARIALKRSRDPLPDWEAWIGSRQTDAMKGC